MRAYPAELRGRVVEAIDRKEGTWAATAARFRVSVGFVGKLLRQRRRTGSIEPRKGWTGSPPALDGSAVERLRAAADERPESTLDELRRRARLACSLPTVCRYLRRLGYSRKNRRSLNSEEVPERRHVGAHRRGAGDRRHVHRDRVGLTVPSGSRR